MIIFEINDSQSRRPAIPQLQPGVYKHMQLHPDDLAPLFGFNPGSGLKFIPVVDISCVLFRESQGFWDIFCNSLHKPPRRGGMRIEKVLPLPGDHGQLF